MKEIFLLFYGALFGALLSAEIGSNHFKVADSRWVAWGWRVASLVIFRACFFALVYSHLSESKGALSKLSSPAASLVALLLCTPVFGFQQLCYVFVGPPGTKASARAATQSGTKTAWEVLWLVNAIVFAVVLSCRYRSNLSLAGYLNLRNRGSRRSW